MSDIVPEQRDALIRRRWLMIERDLERRRRRKTGERPSIATLRVCELNRLFFTRYRGDLLPDDDDGRDSIAIMLAHLAMLAEPSLRIHDWLRRCAPWLSDIEAAPMIERAIAKPITWKADTLAKRLNLDDAERSKLLIKTIGAIDCTKAMRVRRRRQRKRLAKEAQRRASGAKSQSTSASRMKPWKKLGVSRATWYRRLRLFRPQYESCVIVPEIVSPLPLASSEGSAHQTLSVSGGRQSPFGCPSFDLSKSPSRAANMSGGGRKTLDNIQAKVGVQQAPESTCKSTSGARA